MQLFTFFERLRATWEEHAPRRRLLVPLLAALLVVLVLAGPALAQTGVTVFTALGVQDGSAGAPGLTFINDFDTGFYRIGSGNVGYAANGTRVFDIGSTGAITGYVLQYPTPGLKEICGTSNVTTTTTISHGLATPSYVVVSIGQDASADGSLVTYTNSAGVVTLKGWNRAAVPTPVTTPVAVTWCVIGTP